MSIKHKKITQEDKALFREHLNGVKPLYHQQIEPYREKPSARLIPQPEEPQPTVDTLFSDSIAASEITVSESLEFSRNGIQHKTFRKLKRGQYIIEAELDLHGHTVAEARQSLVAFLNEAHHRGLRCVRIIHGKGNSSLQRQPILKKKVNYWLRQLHQVLAFTSAQPRDGGTGAIYLLLAKNRQI